MRFLAIPKAKSGHSLASASTPDFGPSSRKRRMSSSLPLSRETPNEPFGRPSFLPADLALARASRMATI